MSLAMTVLAKNIAFVYLRKDLVSPPSPSFSKIYLFDFAFSVMERETSWMTLSTVLATITKRTHPILD